MYSEGVVPVLPSPCLPILRVLGKFVARKMGWIGFVRVDAAAVGKSRAPPACNAVRSKQSVNVAGVYLVMHIVYAALKFFCG